MLEANASVFPFSGDECEDALQLLTGSTQALIGGEHGREWACQSRVLDGHLAQKKRGPWTPTYSQEDLEETHLLAGVITLPEPAAG